MVARLLNNARGSTLVEAAFVIPFVVFVILSAMAFLRLSYSAVMTQYMASEARKLVVSNNFDGANNRAHRIKQSIKELSANVLVPTEGMQICFRTKNSTGNGCQNDLGAYGDLVHISIRVPVPLYLLGVTYTVRADVLGRNEPMKPSV